MSDIDLRKLFKYISVSGLGQFVAKAWGLKKCITAERVQAFGTLIIAFVTVWTLFFTPIGERIIAEMNRSVEETQKELERLRTVTAKVTLRAVWSKFDDGLAENEYFAKVAADYHAHVEWVSGARPQPSIWWYRIPYRDRFGKSIGIPFEEPSRWGNRLRTIRNWWPSDWRDPGRLDPSDPLKLTEREELRAYLEGLLDEHFGGGGYGTPTMVSDVIEEMKRDEDVEDPGEIAAGMVRTKLDDLLRQHPTLASKPVRIRFTGPYSADEVVEAGEEIGRNVAEFRDALRSFIEIESKPYF